MIRPHPTQPGGSSQPEHHEDWTLVRSALDRQPGAIDVLIERLECVHRILAAMNHDRHRPLNQHDLEDLGQDTLMKVLGKLESFEGRARLETWVYRFCYLEFLNRVRREPRRSGLPIEVEPETRDTNQLENEAELGRIEACLERLGPPKSHVIQLRHFEDLTFAEIGQVLGIPGSTVRTHYQRGLDWLRGELGRRGDSGEES